MIVRVRGENIAFTDRFRIRIWKIAKPFLAILIANAVNSDDDDDGMINIEENIYELFD